MEYVVSVFYEDTFMEFFIKAVFWTSSFEEIKPKLVQTVDQVEKEIEEKIRKALENPLANMRKN